MISELIISLLIFSLGIITTLGFLLYLCRVKCPKCQKKKPVREIITLSHWELKGQHCGQCTKEKTQLEIF